MTSCFHKLYGAYLKYRIDRIGQRIDDLELLSVFRQLEGSSLSAPVGAAYESGCDLRRIDTSILELKLKRDALASKLSNLGLGGK